MELKNAIYGRRSVRSYTAAPVGEEHLADLIKAATFAPSAMNEQPCHFTVVTNRALLATISKDAKAYALQEFSTESHLDHVRQMLTDPRFDILYGAPALVVISAPQSSRWMVENCALAAENLMLAATEMNLGTCWIGFAQAWLGTAPGRAAIKLPSGLTPIAPIVVGHPHGSAESVPRKQPHLNRIR